MPRARRRSPRRALFTIRDAARRLGLAYGTFRHHVLPKLGAAHVGRRWIITGPMLADFLRRPAEPADTPPPPPPTIPAPSRPRR